MKMHNALVLSINNISQIISTISYTIIESGQIFIIIL